MHSSLLIVYSMAMVIWLLSLFKKNAAIVDIFWSLFFLFPASAMLHEQVEVRSRALLVITALTLWALRLSFYLFLRNWGKAEDPRYVSFRKKGGKNFWWTSLFKIFLLQASLALLIGSGLLKFFSVTKASIDSWDLGILLLWTFGFFYESVGDYQLSQFKKNPLNQGKLMTQGLWSTTRHPNYFGEAVQWWAYCLWSMREIHPLLALAGPLLKSFLLLKVSGVSLTERRLSKNKAGFDDYQKRTPAFFPRLWKDQNTSS